MRQEDIAQRLGLNRRTAIAEIENHRRDLRVDELVGLAHVLDTSPAALLAPHESMYVRVLGRSRLAQADAYRSWVFGRRALAGQNVRRFKAHGRGPWPARQDVFEAVDRLLDAYDRSDDEAVDHWHETLDRAISDYANWK